MHFNDFFSLINSESYNKGNRSHDWIFGCLISLISKYFYFLAFALTKKNQPLETVLDYLRKFGYYWMRRQPSWHTEVTLPVCLISLQCGFLRFLVKFAGISAVPTATYIGTTLKTSTIKLAKIFFRKKENCNETVHTKGQVFRDITTNRGALDERERVAKLTSIVSS